MAGLEPARAYYGPTDFKSVASAISPHRRSGANLADSALVTKRFLSCCATPQISIYFAGPI